MITKQDILDMGIPGLCVVRDSLLTIPAAGGMTLQVFLFSDGQISSISLERDLVEIGIVPPLAKYRFREMLYVLGITPAT